VTVGILLITHRPLAADLLRIASEVLGSRPPDTDVLEVVNDTPCERLIAASLALVDRLDSGNGVLVLTDLYGATPANVALKVRAQRPHVRVIGGVNLPMLLKVLNYTHLDLDAVAEKALKGGRDGVCPCEPRD
jgi:mannose PTS system EIIA component